MIVKEFRIPLPMEVDEFRRGQLYAVAECSKNETGGGEGAEFLKQEEFTSSTLVPGKTIHGTYTYKIYRFRSKAPWILVKMLPAEAFEVHEESWNAYPYCKTVLTNPGYMKKDFKLTIESTHLSDNGSSKNPLHCKEHREIVYLDIADDVAIGKRDYNEDTDPKLFESEKTSRGPLQPGWYKQKDPGVPMMCAYKLVTLNFKWTGIGGLVEKTTMKQYNKIFTKYHREAYAWIDDWFDMTLDQIRIFEKETAEKLKHQIKDPHKRGATCRDEADKDGDKENKNSQKNNKKKAVEAKKSKSDSDDEDDSDEEDSDTTTTTTTKQISTRAPSTA